MKKTRVAPPPLRMTFAAPVPEMVRLLVISIWLASVIVVGTLKTAVSKVIVSPALAQPTAQRNDAPCVLSLLLTTGGLVQASDDAPVQTPRLLAAVAVTTVVKAPPA